MFSLNGKNAFITGGANGIGLGVVKRYLAAGAQVVIADIHDASALAAELGAHFVQINVGDEASVIAALDLAVAKVGKLDILVNNAGIGDVGPSFEETEQTLLERMTRINQWGVLYGLKHGPKRMNDGGSIINNASLAAFINIAGSGIYSAAKRAVVSMTEMSALELGARGIRVNAVCPAYVATGMGSGEEGRKLCETLTALGRVSSVEDMVGTFHFLAADDSSYITGQAFKIDGGWSCGPTPQLLELIIGSAHAC